MGGVIPSTPICIHGMDKDSFPFYRDNDSVSCKAIDYKGSFLLGKDSQNVSLVT